jgi:hypothetical protein
MRTAQFFKLMGSSILLLSVICVQAQSDPPAFGGSVTDQPGAITSDPPAFQDDVADLVPIDGGLTLLLAAGVAFGARKANQYRKLKTQ